MKKYRILHKNKTNTGIYSIDILTNNLLSYLVKHNINFDDIVKIIEFNN